MPSEPTLAELLRAIAEEEPLDRAARRLALPAERLVAILREGADALAWSGPKLKPAPPLAAVKPAAARAPAPEAPAAAPAPVPTPIIKSDRFRQLRLNADGAARGNPGPAGAGAVLALPDGTIVARVGRFLGVQTNNVAEYQGVILGLEKAIELGAKEIDIRADSLLVISQLKGEWKLKHPGLKPLFDRAKQLLANFDRVSLQHVRREFNGEADEMSNRAIDERM